MFCVSGKPAAVVMAAVFATTGVAVATTQQEPVLPAYTLEVRSQPHRPQVRQSATLTVKVKEKGSNKGLTAFDEGRAESPLQFFFVREDLGAIYREMPMDRPDAEGAWTHSFAFPSGGEWRVFAAFRPEGAFQKQVMGVKVTVDGVRAPRTSLTPQTAPLVREQGYTLALKTTRLPVGQETPLLFTLTDGQGQGVTDMQLWQGALAHLVLVDRDLKSLVLAELDALDSRNGRTGSLVFKAHFPRAGIYRGWVQFQRLGQVYSIPFTIRAS